MKLAVVLLGLMLARGMAVGQSVEFYMVGGTSQISNSNIGGFVASDGSVQTLSLDNGWRLGARVAFNSWRYFGHEFGYAYNRSHLNYEGSGVAAQGMGIHQGFYDFMLYGTREGKRVRPFAAGGFHFNNYVPPGSSATSGGGSTKFGVNYGGGIKIRVSPIIGIRFDLRQYTNPKPFSESLAGRSGWLRQNEISIGVGVVI